MYPGAVRRSFGPEISLIGNGISVFFTHVKSEHVSLSGLLKGYAGNKLKKRLFNK